MPSSIDQTRGPHLEFTWTGLGAILLSVALWGCGGGEPDTAPQVNDSEAAASEVTASSGRSDGYDAVDAGPAEGTPEGAAANGGGSNASLQVDGYWRIVEYGVYDDMETVDVSMRDGEFVFQGAPDCQRRQFGSYTSSAVIDGNRDATRGAWCQEGPWVLLADTEIEQEFRCAVRTDSQGLTLDCRPIDGNVGQEAMADIGSIPTERDGGFLVRLAPNRLE